MKIKFILQNLIGFFAILFCSSCVTLHNNEFAKRKYMPGFYHSNSKTASVRTKHVQYTSAVDQNIKEHVDYYASNSTKDSGIVNEGELKLLPVIFSNTKKIVKTPISKERDTLILKGGGKLDVEIVSADEVEIKYKRASDQYNELITISKSYLSDIKYSDGRHDVINSVEQNEEKQKMCGWELAGFICFALGHTPFVLSLLLWPLGVLFSIVARIKIKNNPEKFKDAGLAKAVLIALAVEITIALILTALLFPMLSGGWAMG